MKQNPITAELDDIANSIQFLGKRYPRNATVLTRIAARLDTVSNQLDATPPPSRSRKAAAVPEGEWGPEDTYQDAFEASDYHKVPVGKDSLSKALDKNLSDILSDLEFAQTTNGNDRHKINVQAGRKASWPFADLSPQGLQRMAEKGDWASISRAAKMAASRQAAEMEVGLDRTGSDDSLSTGDLAEVGNEDETPPVDKDETGGTLQFYGTVPAGQGPDSGHHRSNVKAPNRQLRMADTEARKYLQRIAGDKKAPVKLKQPDALQEDEPGMDVERDQELGGLSSRRASRTASVKVYRPTHVPKEMMPSWVAAAQHLNQRGRLLNASRQVDYPAVNKVYQSLLSSLARTASKA